MFTPLSQIHEAGRKEGRKGGHPTCRHRRSRRHPSSPTAIKTRHVCAVPGVRMMMMNL